MSNYKTRMINGIKCIREEEFCESEEEFCEQFICSKSEFRGEEKEPCSAATEDKAQA